MTATSSILAGAAYTDARHASFDVAGRDTNITYLNYESEVKEVLSTLKPADRSGCYVQPCMEGTRENVLREINAWLLDISTPNLLWIKGCPGAGKSTIASSLISRLMRRR